MESVGRRAVGDRGKIHVGLKGEFKNSQTGKRDDSDVMNHVRQVRGKFALSDEQYA